MIDTRVYATSFAECCPSSSDKQYGHGYGSAYDQVVLPCLDRRAALSVVEIGIHNGGSMRLWENLFPHARVFGIDIDPRCTESESSRTRVFIGNAATAGVIAQVLTAAGDAVDLVVDDGSHVEGDYLATFSLLFPSLAPGGVYVVEDMETSDMSRFARAVGTAPVWMVAWTSTYPGRWIGVMGNAPWMWGWSKLEVP